MEDARFASVVHKLDPQARLLRSRAMIGGISARVTALELERADGLTQKVIVRQHGEADRKRNPQVAADEFRLLELLRAAGIAVPAPFFADQSGEIFPEPYVVMEYVEGSTDFAPSNPAEVIHQMAEHLSRIHRTECPAFLPEREQVGTRPNPAVLLHGDFWPGNVLWKSGQVAAIIDWEDAAVGDPLADVANARLEILWAFGAEAMLDFTDLYQSMEAFDFTDLPWWDLWAARRAARFPEWAAADRMESMRGRYQWFVAQAQDVLSGRGSGCALE